MRSNRMRTGPVDWRPGKEERFVISQLLAQRAAEANPIRVGIIGTGKFGAGLVAQISQMEGWK